MRSELSLYYYYITRTHLETKMKGTIRASSTFDGFFVDIRFEGHVAAQFPKFVNLKEAFYTSYIDKFSKQHAHTVCRINLFAIKGNAKNEIGLKRLKKIMEIAGDSLVDEPQEYLNYVPISQVLATLDAK